MEKKSAVLSGLHHSTRYWLCIDKTDAVEIRTALAGLYNHCDKVYYEGHS